MEFRLLGPLELVDDGGRAVELPAGKPRALLALLVLEARRIVSVDRIVDALWGEAPPATAEAVVQGYASRLRKLLPDGALLRRGHAYVLHIDEGGLDLDRFERLRREGVAAAEERRWQQAAALLEAALALWRGRPLAEFEDETFARDETARLRELRLVVLQQRLQADLALGRAAEVVPELTALAREEPLRERLREQLMLAFYRAGRQADALAAYQDARVALRDELGIEPSPALRELERQILAQDPALDVAPPRPAALAAKIVLPGPLVPAPRSPFVGRARELGLLRSLLGRAEAGDGALAVVVGEAGSGKTRLVRELGEEAAERGTLVLYGASDASVVTPYQPLRDWFRFLLRVGDSEALAACLEDADPSLARLLPELARLVVTPPRPLGEPEPYVLQSSAIEFLRRASGLQPLLLVVDDLHWADEETLAFLRRLARTAPEAALLIVAATRTRGNEVRRPLDDTLADVSRLEGVTRLTLGAFSADEVRTFVEVSARGGATLELARELATLTGGSPLLLCELWGELVERGAVEVSDERVRLVRPVGDLGGSDQIRELVQRRLSRLSRRTVDLLGLAAASGSRVELRVLADAVELEPSVLVDSIEEAARNGFVEEVPEQLPAYRFTHELVRRAVYDGLNAIHRAELHLRLGKALERIHAGDPAGVLPELAHHFTLAAPLGDVERAVEYNYRAAEAAIVAAALDEAITHYETALGLGVADPRDRARFQLELAGLYRARGRIAEGHAMFVESLKAPTGALERGDAAHALMMRMGSPMGDPRCDPQLYWSISESAVEAWVELGNWQRAARASNGLGMAGRRAGRIGDACAALERGLVYVDQGGDQRARRGLSGTLAYAMCDGPTPVREAMRRCDELLRAGQTDGTHQAIVGRSLALLSAMAGRFDDTRALLERTEPVLERYDELTHSWAYLMIVAQARELIGDRAGAEETLIAKWHWFRDLGDFPVDARSMQAAHQLALVYCDEGRWDDAEPCLAFGDQIPVPSYFLHEAVLGLAARARVSAYRGDLERGLAVGRQAVELAEQSDFLNLQATTWLALGEALRRAGDEQRADAAVATALDRYSTKGNVAAAARLLDSPTSLA